ncbi:MAG: hypothetical protein EOO06_09385 [Chitinophagaceae bacterium]|nr:MAG: hypothetical protein EOO06_09385 [Chitinophagaceae bacterium]
MNPEYLDDFSFVKGLYNVTSAVYSCFEKRVKTDKDRGWWPHTTNVLYYSIKKIDWLLNPLEQLDPERDESFYLMYVYIRPIIEHFFIAYYIQTKTRVHGVEHVARQYYNERFNSEQFKRIGYRLKFEAILDRRTPVSLLEEIKVKYASNIPYSEIERVHKVGRQFDFDKIIEYFAKHVPEDDVLFDFNKYATKLFQTYNIASNYLHGGILADEEHFRTEGIEESKLVRLNGNVFWGRICSLMLKQILLEILRLRNTEYKDCFIPIQHFNWMHGRENGRPDIGIKTYLQKITPD